MVPVSESHSQSRRTGESFANVDPAGQDEDGLQAALERSDSVLDHQLEALADLDSKAVWTVRLEVVLLGVFASVARMASDVPANVWMRIGSGLFIASMVVGVFTYSVTDPDVGPGPDSFARLVATKADKVEWYLSLLDGYSTAIAHNRAVLRDNARYLLWTKLLFVAGVLATALGTLLAM